MFTRPWKMSMPLYRRQEKDIELLEYDCGAYLLKQEWEKPNSRFAMRYADEQSLFATLGTVAAMLLRAADHRTSAGGERRPSTGQTRRSSHRPGPGWRKGRSSRPTRRLGRRTASRTCRATGTVRSVAATTTSKSMNTWT